MEKFNDHKAKSLSEWKAIATDLGIEIADGASKRDVMEAINAHNGHAEASTDGNGTEASTEASTDGTEASTDGTAAPRAAFRATGADIEIGTSLAHEVRGVRLSVVTKTAEGWSLDVDGGSVHASLTSAAVRAEQIRNGDDKKRSINGRDYFGLDTASKRGPRDPNATPAVRSSSKEALEARLAKLVAAQKLLTDKIAMTEKAIAEWKPTIAVDDDVKALKKQLEAEAKAKAKVEIEAALAKFMAEKAAAAK